MTSAYGRTFKFTAIFLVAVLFCLPVLNDIALAQGTQTSDYLTGKMDGERDAKAGAGWFFAGFCLGAAGVLIAYLVKPNPSTALLVGKSNEYIMGYTEGYRDKSAKKQGSIALSGCAVFAVVYLTLVLVAASSSTSD